MCGFGIVCGLELDEIEECVGVELGIDDVFGLVGCDVGFFFYDYWCGCDGGGVCIEVVVGVEVIYLGGGCDGVEGDLLL